MHTSCKLYCLGVGELVVGHIFCFCLTVDKTYLMCEEDISVVPVVCGNITELVFYGDFGNLYFVGLFFLCLGGLFGDAEGVACYKFDIGIEGNECIGLIALCWYIRNDCAHTSYKGFRPEAAFRIRDRTSAPS